MDKEFEFNREKFDKEVFIDIEDLGDESLAEEFFEEMHERGLIQRKGHYISCGTIQALLDDDEMRENYGDLLRDMQATAVFTFIEKHSVNEFAKLYDKLVDAAAECAKYMEFLDEVIGYHDLLLTGMIDTDKRTDEYMINKADKVKNIACELGITE